jgi:hypothetical protein
MKVKYTISKELLSMVISLKGLEKKIVHELTLLKANNISTDGNIVTFKNEDDIRSTHSLMSILKDGYFEILQEEDKIKITFVSYYSLYNELLIFFISLLMAFVITYGFFVGCVFSVISYIVKYLLVSNECDFLMSKLAGESQ